MKKIGLLCLTVVLLLLLSTCDNAIQVALPGILTTNTPTTNPAPGVYNHDLSAISLHSNTDGARIYYTCDNTEPTEQSTLYTNPLDLTGHGQELYIRAIAMKDGKDSSPEMTASFFVEHSGPPVPDFIVTPDFSYTGSPQRADGTWKGDINIALAASPYDPVEVDGRWIEGEVRYAYTLDGTIPMINTDVLETDASSAILNPSTLTATAGSPLASLTETGEITISIAAYVIVDSTDGSQPMAFPMSTVKTRRFRVVYDNEIPSGFVPELLSPAGLRAEPFDLVIQTPGGSSDYSICYTMSGVKGGSSFQNSEPVTVAGPSYTLPVFQGSDWSALEEMDSLTLKVWLIRDQYQPGETVQITFIYAPGKPRQPEIVAVLPDGSEIASGNTIAGGPYSDVKIEIRGDDGSDIYYTTLNGVVPDNTKTLYNDTNGVTMPGNPSQGDFFRIDAISYRGADKSLITTAWFSFDTTLPTAPDKPDLPQLQDSGFYNDDDITRINSPDIVIPTPGEGIITLFNGNQPITTRSCDGSDLLYSFSIPLDDGNYTIRTIFTNTVGAYSESEPLNLVIDTIEPSAAMTLISRESNDSNGRSDYCMPTGTAKLSINLSNINDTSGIGEISYASESTGLTSFTDYEEWTSDYDINGCPISTLSDYGSREVRVKLKDLAGNESGTYISDNINNYYKINLRISGFDISDASENPIPTEETVYFEVKYYIPGNEQISVIREEISANNYFPLSSAIENGYIYFPDDSTMSSGIILVGWLGVVGEEDQSSSDQLPCSKTEIENNSASTIFNFSPPGLYNGSFWVTVTGDNLP